MPTSSLILAKMSDSEYDSDGEEQLETNGETLEFGFEDEKKELTGRRLKAHKEQKKKMRPGTFGTSQLNAPCCSVGLCLWMPSGQVHAAVLPAHCVDRHTPVASPATSSHMYRDVEFSANPCLQRPWA